MASITHILRIFDGPQGVGFFLAVKSVSNGTGTKTRRKLADAEESWIHAIFSCGNEKSAHRLCGGHRLDRLGGCAFLTRRALRSKASIRFRQIRSELNVWDGTLRRSPRLLRESRFDLV